MKTRQKIALAMILITVMLAAVVILLPIDQVLISYSSRNEVEELTLVSKAKGFWLMVIIPVWVGLVWNYFSGKTEKKIEAEPGNMNHRAKAVFQDILFFIWSSVGAIIGIINIIRAVLA